MNVVQLEQVSKIYNPGLFQKKVQAVSDLNLEVRTGEIFGLIGPNGAGKSTTIRMILGLIRPDSGRVLFHGQPPRGLDLQREIGYLPENPYLYDHLHLDELLVFCGRVSGMAPAVVTRRGEELMKKLALWDSRKRPLRTFSKGMMQRAGICFALLHDPSVVILDEPMSGLDPVGRKMVYDLVQELKVSGKTVFFCSHILNDVERLCDRIGMMVYGQLRQLFDKEVFSVGDKPQVHLVAEGITPAVMATLGYGDQHIFLSGGQTVLSVEPRQVGQVTQELAALGGRVVGSRSAGISLEERFLQVVEENVA